MKRETVDIPPDRPSPIPAWQHYYISQYAQKRIMEELDQNNPDSLLAGLTIGYLHVLDGKPVEEAENRYCMSYGYWVGCDEVEVEAELTSEAVLEEEKEVKEPGLRDEFIDELFDEVRELILKTAPDDGSDYLVSLVITTAHCSDKPKLECSGKQCAPCSKHSAPAHLFKLKKNKKKTACEWVCQNKDCH